ncbi:MAG: PqqD family peptide modification chaperone [Rhizomicrobium sp.]
MIASKQGDWMTAKIGEELVMMSVNKGNYLGLSEVGARIWEMLETPMDVAALCQRLQAEYDVPPEICRAEVEAFLNKLESHGAVVLASSPAA